MSGREIGPAVMMRRMAALATAIALAILPGLALRSASAQPDREDAQHDVPDVGPGVGLGIGHGVGPGVGEAILPKHHGRPIVNLTVELTAPSSVSSGETFAFDLTVRNDGPADAQGAQLEYTPDSRTRFVSTETDPNSDCWLDDELVRCDLGRVTAHQSKTIKVMMRTPATLGSGTVLHSFAEVSSEGVRDSNPGDNASSTTVLVNGGADLDLTMAGPASLRPGEDADYTIAVENSGSAPANGIQLRLELPDELVPGTRPRECNTELTCTRDKLGPGDVWEIRLRTKVAPDAEAGVTLAVKGTVTSSSPDVDDENNHRSTSDVIEKGHADLQVESKGPAEIKPGTKYEHVVVVSNSGPAVAHGVRATVELDHRLTVVSSPVGCEEVQPHEWSCDIGTIPVGEHIELVFVVRPEQDPADPSPIAVDVSVSSETDDPSPASNSSSSTAKFSPVKPTPKPPPTREPAPVPSPIEPAAVVPPPAPAPAPQAPPPPEPEPAPAPKPKPQPKPEPPAVAKFAMVPSVPPSPPLGAAMPLVVVSATITSMVVAVRMFTRR